MKKHPFRSMLMIILLFIVLFAAWVWWLPSWLNQKIQTSLSNQGFVVEQLTWDHIGWYSSQIKTLRLRAINNKTEWDITNLTVKYQPTALFNNHLVDVEVHTTAVHGKWFQDPYASGIALGSPLAWLAVIPLGLIQIDEWDLSQYVEQKLFRRWHGSITVKQGQVEARLSESEDSLFRGMTAALTVSQQGDIYAFIQLNDKPLASLQGMLHEVGDTVRLQASFSMQVKPMLQYFPVIIAGKRLKGDGLTSVDVRATVNKGIYQTSNAILHSLGIELDWHFQGALKQAGWHSKGNINGHIAWHDHKGIWRIAAPQFTAKGENWRMGLGKHQLQGGFYLGKDDAYATLDAAAFMEWATLRWHGVILDGVKFQNIAMLRSSWLGRSSPWETQITLPTLFWMKQRFSSKSMHLLLPAPTANHAFNATLSIQDFQWDNTSMHLPKGDITLTMQWDKELQASLHYAHDKQRPWQFDMAWQPNTGKGTIDFDLGFNKPEVRLKEWFPASRTIFKKLSLPQGHIAAKGRISLNAGLWQGRGRLALNDLQGSYTKKIFSDLNADVPFTLNSNGIQLSQATIQVADIDAGIPLHNVKINFAVDHRMGRTTRLNIATLAFNTLGGQVWASDINIDTAKLNDKIGNPFTVRVKNINIAELIALEQQKKIQATGILDGVFPSNFRREGVFVSQGTLTARAPGGIIRYIADEGVRAITAQNMGAKLAFQVLNNFQYHQLDAKVDYDADGSLLLGLHVKGKNPAYDHGRPIEFNIQVKENLLDLLQSLSMANNISDQIEQRVDKKENP